MHQIDSTNAPIFGVDTQGQVYVWSKCAMHQCGGETYGPTIMSLTTIQLMTLMTVYQVVGIAPMILSTMMEVPAMATAKPTNQPPCQHYY